MTKSTDVTLSGATLYLIPVQMRVPLKFGIETVTDVTVARSRVEVQREDGRTAVGWGETPLSVSWVWPSRLTVQERLDRLVQLSAAIARDWPAHSASGHPMEIGHGFVASRLPRLLDEHNAAAGKGAEPMPWLGALVCCSAFDIALHDAYGVLLDKPTYETYGPEYMNADLSGYLHGAADTSVSFEGLYPQDFFVANRPDSLPAWHLVGGVDAIDPDDLTGREPQDGYPVLLPEWIERDGLKCLKIKLRGNDEAWDYARTVRVGEAGIEHGVDWLSADFNCTVTDPEYVNRILDRLRDEYPRIYGMLLYVEQPFPYELEEHAIDVHSVSARKPLFMDESAHDWHLVRRGRELGWTGVALKTCKTQTGALLSMCWAKAHGMGLMVQDLTNPMLAQVPHVLLAAYAGTIMGVETNAMQFYPDASAPEAVVHPGLYKRRGGNVDLSTIGGSGFGYRLNEIERDLPEPVA